MSSNNDVINLKGLLGDNLILYNKILNDFYNKILKYDIISNINCNIIFKKINLKDSYNCNIELINKCITNKTINLNIFIQSLLDNKESISQELRLKIEKKLGIDFEKTAEANENNNLTKICNVSASVSNDIYIKELNILNCTGSQALNFLFYNTGSANVNCGIIELINTISNDETEENENSKNLLLKYNIFLNKIFNLNLNDLFIISSFLIIIFILIISIIVYFKKSKIFRYVTKFFLKK